MKRLLSIILGGLLLASPVLAWENSKIVNNGVPENRVNLIMLGDGYRESELSKYKSDVQNVINGQRY